VSTMQIVNQVVSLVFVTGNGPPEPSQGELNWSRPAIDNTVINRFAAVLGGSGDEIRRRRDNLGTRNDPTARSDYG